MLVGLPGSGKSTLARALAPQLPDARVIDKDHVRDALFAPCDYSSVERSVTYSAMLEAARYHLGRARIVFLDGLTFSRRHEVAAAETVAIETGAFTAVIVCDVPVEEAVRRCEGDAAAGRHRAGNRDGDLVRRVAREMEEPSGSYLTLTTTRPVEELVGPALAWIGECAP